MRSNSLLAVAASVVAAAGLVAVVACNGKGSNPVGPGGNIPPTISAVVADPTTLLAGGTASVSATVSDPDGDSFECSWTAPSGTFTPSSTDGCRAQWRAGAAGGAVRLALRVADRRGASASSGVDVTVQAAASNSPSPTPTPTPAPGEPDPTPTPTPTAPPGPTPAIASFSASPASISAGQASTLSWSTQNAKSVSIDQGIGSVTTSGSVQVQPGASTTYRLTATGDTGATVTSSTSVAVGQPTCTPPTISGMTGGGSCHPRPGSPCTKAVGVNASGSGPLQYSWGGCCGGTGSNTSCSVDSIASVACSVTVSNNCGQASSQMLVQGTNSAPTGSASAAGAGCHPYPGSCSVGVNASGSDPDGDPLTYSWSGCASGSGASASCTVPSGATGSQTATVSIGDGWTSLNKNVNVQGQNQSPSASASGGGSCHPRPGSPCTTNVSGSGSDPDGDPLTYSWSGCASGLGQTSSCAVSGLGNNTATVTVADPFGASRNANVTSTGTNVPATATITTDGSAAGGAVQYFRVGWSNSDGDAISCSLASTDARCFWRPGCTIGGSASGNDRCRMEIEYGTPQGGVTCTLSVTCKDVWDQGSTASVVTGY